MPLKSKSPMWKRKGAAKKVLRKRRIAKVKRGVKEWASMTESVVPGTLAPNTNYASYNLSLAQLPRAINVAKSYQYYRIKRVTYVIKPNSDTFTPGVTTGLPYLYYMIDRTQQFQSGFTVDMLRSAGAKPRRVDEKTIEFSYTPSVLNLTYDATVGSAANVSYKMCPWLPTRDIAQVGVWNPNSTDHQGIAFHIQSDGGGAGLGFSFERRFEIEFKKPIIQRPSTEVPTPEDLDRSVSPL